ncbi:MAG: glycosyltransferase [Flavobacteriales bacterium]|nr:glycosyltransferase [Flavobacteriales bacterium]
MNVLFLPGWYPNRTHATLGNFVQRHAEAVATLHDVTVVHAVRDNSAKGMEWETRSTGRLAEHVLYTATDPLQRLRAVYRRIAHLQKHSGPFEVMHGNILHATAPMLWLAQRRWKLPFLVSENWSGYHLNAVQRLPLATRMAMRAAGRRASMLCPVSLQLAEALRRHGFHAPFRVIPNVVDTDQFHLPETPRTTARTRLLHVSTLVDEVKNITGLLQAFAAAKHQAPALELHILGDGELGPHQATAERLGLGPGAVRFSGAAEHATIARHMRESDAFVLPSHVENLPCVMLEAFATGLPVLATAVGGIPEHLSSERGILVPRGDTAALRDGMVALAEGRQAYNPEAIRDYAVSRFSQPVVAQAFDDAYRHIIKHG